MVVSGIQGGVGVRLIELGICLEEMGRGVLNEWGSVIGEGKDNNNENNRVDGFKKSDKLVERECGDMSEWLSIVDYSE